MMRVVVVFSTAVAVFVLLAVATSALPDTSVPWLEQVILKSSMILFAFAAIAFDRSRGLRDYGFRRPHGARWLLVIGAGLLLGMVTTTMIVLTPAQGMKKMFAGFGFLEIVLWIWIYSSISEEVFVRSWYQTLAGPGAAAGRTAEVSSALLFGSMHLSLIAKGADAMTVVIIVTATTILGLGAARLRAVTGSILPAIVTHIAFNFGGATAGIGLTILSIVTDGTIPRP